MIAIYRASRSCPHPTVRHCCDTSTRGELRADLARLGNGMSDHDNDGAPFCRRASLARENVCSPTNKIVGSHGRESYDRKFQEVMHSSSRLVEIDLLRGARTVRVPRTVGTHEYLIHISRKGLRPRSLLYPQRLLERLPAIPIPLKASDPDACLDLQAMVDETYDRAGYDLEIDYAKEPIPPLDTEMTAWADEMLRSKGLR
jgi:Protein of unknown function (DUF4058)